MLSPADAVLVRRDLGIPGLAAVLDPETVAGLVQSAMDWRVRIATPTYVRYKPDTSCLVGYRIETTEGEVTCYAKALGRGDADKLRRMSRGSPAGPVRVLPFDDALIAISTFPADHDLRVLRLVADKQERRRLLSSLLPGRSELCEGGIRTLHYKPERRYVACLPRIGPPAVVLKAYTSDDYPAARAAAGAFRAAGPLRTARRLASSERHRIVAFEWLPGRALTSVMRRDPSVLRGVGRALRILHEQSNRLRPVTREAEAQRLMAAARAVTALMPDLAASATTLAGRLAARLCAFGPMAIPTHGDFSADQVLLEDSHVAFIDTDDAARGDPASDLGSFAADLHIVELEGRLAEGQAEGLMDELLAGYGRPHLAGAEGRLPAYTAAGLLRRAVEPFRYRLSDWPERTARLVQHAWEIIPR